MTSSDIHDLDFDAYLDLIRHLTDDELIPGETDMVDLGEVPPALVARLAQTGLFGITLPREWGGLGWTMEQQVRLTFEFTRASPVYRSRFSTTIGLCSQILLDHGTDEQRERYLRDMATGRCVASFALTETGAGSDATAVTTTAVRDGDQYIIDGHKRFITNGAWADLLVVFARTGDDRFSAILVPADTEGVTATLPTRMNGHEAGPVAELTFVDVRVPTTNLIGDEGAGLTLALRGINHARTHVAATAVGCATRLLTEAAAHALTRHQFGQPIAGFGVIEAMLGRSRAELEAARALILDCARAWDAGSVPWPRIAAAKLVATETAKEIADRAVQILGGEGIVGDHPVGRLWRDVRALSIYEGTTQIHERNLARHLLKAVGDGRPIFDS
jgi:acyl-CoA dehydrogenase